MWSSWGDSFQQALEKTGDVLEKTGDSLSKVATNARKNASRLPPPEAAAAAPADGSAPPPIVQGRYAATSNADTATNKSPIVLKSFQAGWSSVVEQTKASITKAQHAVEEQQHKMQSRLQKARAAYYKRDPKLPLDVPALQDAQVVYVTDRIISMGHPAMASNTDGEITAERKLAAVGHLLHRRHDGRYMVWNISEVEYDISILDDQVLTFSFPGSPSPPLGLLLKLLVSMESWLKADDRNVAVVHCLTGKGRTSTVLAAFLCWMGEANFSDIHEALNYIAQCKQITMDDLTIPSQRRYVSYFKNMLDGVRPSQPPVMLRRVIMSVAPRYARGPPRNNNIDNNNSNKNDGTTEDKKAADEALWGCAPYLQVFKAGNLLHTAPASLHFQQDEGELPFCQVADGSISFHINTIVQGDILLRCRHLTGKKQRVSMFRAAFHTGYVPPNVMRISKSQLDGACQDDRFDEDFYLDVIFETVDAEQASQVLQQEEEEAIKEHGHNAHAAVSVDDSASSEAKALAGGGTTVTASAYDSMLHRDSRFWDVIVKRKQEHAAEQQQQNPPSVNQEGQDPLWGPTVGRRREFKSAEASSTTDGANASAGVGATGSGGHAALETFSIGAEFDFLPSAEDAKAEAEAQQPKPKRKPDSLMEALMGALNDDDDEEEEEEPNMTETIIFDNGHNDDSTAPVAPTPSPTIVAIPPADGSTEKNSDAAPEGAKTETTSEAASPSQGQQPEPADATNNAKYAAAGSADQTKTAMQDMEALLLGDDDGDDDVDALLASAGGGDDDAGADDDALDLSDQDLVDLENFLSEK